MNHKIGVKRIFCFMLSAVFLNNGPWLKNDFSSKTSRSGISQNAFMLKEELNSLGTGENESTEKIILGNLPADVQYDDGAMINTDDGSTGVNDIQIKSGTPIEWYVVGTDTKGTSKTPQNAVLCSVKPVMSEGGLFNDFNVTDSEGEIDYSRVGDRGIDYSPKKAPSQIFSAHYGASRIRRLLNEAVNGGKMFKSGQYTLIQDSTFTTFDPKQTQINYTFWESNGPYKLTDKIYLASATNNESNFYYNDGSSGGVNKPVLTPIYVGESTQFPIVQKYLGPKVWLRTSTADLDSHCYISAPAIEKKESYYESGTPATSGAIKINLSNVKFLSKVRGVSDGSTSNFAQVDRSKGMFLRMNGGKGSIRKKESTVHYSSAPENSRLVAVAEVGDVTYEFSEDISGEGSIDLSKKGLPEGAVYDAWIEQLGVGADEGLIFASNTTAEAIASGPFDQMSNGVRVTAAPGVFPEGSQLDVNLSSNNKEGYEIIKKFLSNPGNLESFTVYDVKVYAPNDAIARSNSEDKSSVDNFSEATVYLPISEKMDINNIQDYFLTPEGFIQGGKIEEYKGKKYYVFRVKGHFNTYISLNSFNGVDFFKTGDTTCNGNAIICTAVATTAAGFLIYLLSRKKAKV